VTLKGQDHDRNMLRSEYLENSWRCYLPAIANYWIIVHNSVRSAILATAWILVELIPTDGIEHEWWQCRTGRQW